MLSLVKKKLWKKCQKTFISSTFWTERIGPSAAIKTIEVMKELKSWNIINKISKKIKKNMENLAKEKKLDLSLDLTSSNFKF